MEGAAELVKTLERFPQVASVEAASDGIRVFSQGTDGLLPQDCAGGPFLGVPEPPPVAADGGADQPYRIHELGFTGRAHPAFPPCRRCLLFSPSWFPWPFWAG